MWNDAVGYETYVGHWSRAVAPRFLDWLALPTRLRWLDVACRTGALTSAILARCGPEESSASMAVHRLVGDSAFLTAFRAFVLRA
jgi:hypothetical protein